MLLNSVFTRRTPLKPYFINNCPCLYQFACKHQNASLETQTTEPLFYENTKWQMRRNIKEAHFKMGTFDKRSFRNQDEKSQISVQILTSRWKCVFFFYRNQRENVSTDR